MALSYVGGTSGTGTGATFNVSLSGTLTGGSGSSPIEGDLIIVCAGFGATASSAPTCSGNTSGTYQNVHAALYSNDTWDTNMRTFYQFAGATPDTTLTIGRTSSAAYGGVAVVHVWRGVDPNTPIDVAANTTAANNQSASRPNPPSHTPSTAGAVVIACGTGMQTTAGAAFTIPSGMTNGVSAHNDGTTSDCGTFICSFDWTSGAYDPAAATGGTTSTSGSWAAATFSLRPEPPPNYTLTCNHGTYSLTGQSAGVNYGRVLVAQNGSYALAGQDAVLTYTPVVTGYTLTCNHGTYALTGNSASLVKGLALTAQHGTYEVAGQGATLVRSRLLTAQHGTYTVTGQSAGLVKGLVLVAQHGTYTLAGQAADLVRGRALVAQHGTYTLAGQDAALLVSRLLVASPGSYTVAGQNATIVYSGAPPAAEEGTLLQRRRRRR